MADPLHRKTEGKGSTDVQAGSADLFSAPAPDNRGPEYGYSKIRIRRKDDFSPYDQAAAQAHAMDRRKRICLIIGIAVPILFCAILLLPDTTFNDYHAKPSIITWISDLTTNVQNLTAALSLQAYTGTMVFKICQYLICCFAGAALAANGAVFQGSLKNALASPTTLGVTGGATLGSIFFILYADNPLVLRYAQTASEYRARFEGMNIFQYILATNGQALCSLAGSIVVVVLVLAIAYLAGRGKVSKSALVIAGSVFSTLIGGIMQLVRYWLSVNGDSDQIDAVSSLATGTLAQTFVPLDVALIGIPLAICLIVLLYLRTRINLLAFSDEEARSMGLSPRAERNLTVGICTVATAVVIAFCGNVGFVGFMVPHIARKLVGPDFRYLLPCSMVLGAGVMMASNLLSNEILSGLGTGTITSVVGMVAFIYVIIKQRKQGNRDWI